MSEKGFSSKHELKNSPISDLIKQLEEKYKERDQMPAWQLEKQSWETILDTLISDRGGIGFNYRLDKVLGVGGAGAVFRVIDCNLYVDLDPNESKPENVKRRRSYRALKVPRPHLEKGPSLADSLRDEINRLTALSHPNVISLFAKGQIHITMPSGATTWPWYIMGYMHRATDLQKLCAKNPPPLQILIRYLFDAAKGLQYIHDNNVVHCDFKPENIFLPEDTDPLEQPCAVLADFGYAKHLDIQPGITTIGFTELFAHPDLRTGAIQSSQDSRTFKKLPRKSIRPAFDLFAFGMTIDYLLDKFYKKYSIHKEYAYELKYLRLCSARLLDGLNHQKSITYAKLPYYCFRDTGTEDTDSFVAGIRYKSTNDLVVDLAKLLGESTPEVEIPELIETRPENIQVSDSAPTIYTDRLRKVVDHPLVRRLASATQLGLISLVYPGATHSRLEHALGTFGVTARYIRSLYNDTLDPLFRQLVDTSQMKATLLAALIHDIGQYPLAHDLEDVSSKFFSHENFGAMLLSTDTPTMGQKILFPELEDEPSDLACEFEALIETYWGVTLEHVRRILNARSSESKRKRQIGSHVERLCKSLIDGPIDADKVDYLQRDSRHCNVKYGYGIDTGRLFRCLTIATNNIKDDQLLMVMGVHEKGRIAAESILFVRYAMLTQVYWHHTMRAIKALLHHAAAEFLATLEHRAFESKRKEFFRCAVLEDSIHSAEWNKVVARAEAVGIIHSGDLRVLSWLWENTSHNGKVAIEHILNRHLFKRLTIVYRFELTEKERSILDVVYAPDNYQDRCALREAIQKALLVRLKSASCPPAVLDTVGLSEQEWEQRLDEQTQLRCLVDYPALRSGSSFGLQVVGQWGEHPSTTTSEDFAPMEPYPRLIPADHFQDGMKELEKSIACLRVYWSPGEHVLVKETLGDNEIRSVVSNEIKSFKPGNHAS